MFDNAASQIMIRRTIAVRSTLEVIFLFSFKAIDAFNFLTLQNVHLYKVQSLD